MRLIFQIPEACRQTFNLRNTFDPFGRSVSLSAAIFVFDFLRAKDSFMFETIAVRHEISLITRRTTQISRVWSFLFCEFYVDLV